MSPISSFYFWWRQGIYYSFLKNIYSYIKEKTRFWAYFMKNCFFEANFNSILGLFHALHFEKDDVYFVAHAWKGVILYV